VEYIINNLTGIQELLKRGGIQTYNPHPKDSSKSPAVAGVFVYVGDGKFKKVCSLF